MQLVCQYLHGLVNQSLQDRSPRQCYLFNCAIECTRTLLEFYMDVMYSAHNDATLSYMEDGLCHLHTFKDVFLHG